MHDGYWHGFSDKAPYGENPILCLVWVLLLKKWWFRKPKCLYLYLSVTAANQKEALKSGFCVKEEPEPEEASSPAKCPAFSLGHDAPSVPTRTRQEGSILSHDINVKVASELLMKLSGKTFQLSVVPRRETRNSKMGPKFSCTSYTTPISTMIC